MVPFKRPATDKSGMPVYPPGAATATTYQQLMQLQHPFVPVSCEYQTATSISTTQASQPQYLPSTTTSNAVVNPIANNNNLNNNVMSIKNNNIINSNPSETFTTIATTCATSTTTPPTTFPSSVTCSNNINSNENNIKNNNTVVNVNVPVTVASNLSCSSNSNDNINVNGGVTNSEESTNANDNTTTTINTNGTSNTNELTNSMTSQESAVNVASSTSSSSSVASTSSSSTVAAATVTTDPTNPAANPAFNESQDHMDNNNNNSNNILNVAVTASSSFENGTTHQTQANPSQTMSHYQNVHTIYPYALPTSQSTSLPQQQLTATYSYPQSALAAAYANYYQDPATIAKEVAQKNYAYKLAASSNAFTGKTLTSYAGMAALNKPLITQQLTATPTGLRVAPPVAAAAAGTAQTATNPFAQRQAPLAANYFQQMQAAQAQYLRPQMNPFAAAVAQQQLLIPQQQHIQPQFFQYPGMIPGVAASYASYGIPMSAAGAIQTSTTPMAQVSSMQQQPQVTTNSTVVLNPYKKMKTS